MSRFARISILVLLLTGAWSVTAQDQAFPTLPPVDTPMPLIPTATPTPEQAVQATPVSLGIEQTEAIPVLINDRADLELLADTKLGVGQRPNGWSGSIDVTDPQLPLLIRLDLETLAGAVMGVDSRPAGWFGVVPSVPVAVARDIRHDLELLADGVIGAQGIRPAGWKGDDPMMRCSRATQSLFMVLQKAGNSIPVDFTQPNYCAAAETAASLFVEQTILQPPASASASANQGLYPYQVANSFVIAYLDRKARQQTGVLPLGTGFQAVGRSYSDFSNMMLITGENFEVFVDYTTTPVTAEQFQALPDVTADETTSCDADWCG